MTSRLTVMKQQGGTEPYRSEKLRTSIEKACLSVREPAGSAHKTAELVTAKTEAWLKTKTEVTSRDIRLQSEKILAAHSPEAAYIYKNYKHIL